VTWRERYIIMSFCIKLEFKMTPMLLIVNGLFAYIKDIVDSSFKIRRLLKFAYCVKNVVL